MATEILFGINTAEEILNAGRRRVVRLLISRDEKGQRVSALSGLARSKGVPVEFCASLVLEKLAKGGHHQGVIIEAEPPTTRCTSSATRRKRSGPPSTASPTR